ncbi:ABC transporter permease subunit [Parasphingorhabdus pacifica]
MSKRGSITALAGWALLGVPLFAAVLGWSFAGSTRSESAPLLPPAADHVLGTDVLGRDVLALALTGGFSVVSLTVLSLALTYLVGVPFALISVGQRRRWLDEAMLHGMDMLLALPGLLVLLVLAATGRQGVTALVLAVATLQLPAVVRIARSAALAPDCRTVVEAMIMQGESWWRIHLVHTGRAVLGPVRVDMGSRLILVLHLMASANFLGVGLAPATSDWAVLVERNREALFLQPLAVLVPALLLVALCTGVNLVVDRTTADRSVVRT